MNLRILLALTAIALATLACSVNVDLGDTDIKTGPTQTYQISVPLLDDPEDTANVELAFGAGTLEINPGAEDALVSGTATYNIADFEPVVSVEGTAVSIEQGELDLDGFPTINDDVTNRWELMLGNAPIALTVNAGAYSGQFELGGLSLERLEINDGAANVDVTFSQPNLVEMSLFQYTTGASDVSLEGLANTHAAELVFESGAGSYTLDFSGELAQDMDVSIESGLSSVIIIIPSGVSAVVNTDGGLMNISYTGDWAQDGSTYTMSGDTPTITIFVEMGAGSLLLQN